MKPQAISALLALLLAGCAGVERVATAPVAPTGPARTPAAAPAAGPRPAAPGASVPRAGTLDLAALENRLRATSAIGVFTKLSLKNQVDDLLEQFRGFYRGKIKITLAELRAPFDRLLLKVLSLLQDGDPPLAQAIVASREAMWRILADSATFAALELAEGDTR